MNDAFLEKLIRTYAEHPLTAASILDRLRRQRGSLDGIDEMDLAVDEETGVTDQNHPGGLETVRAIARAVGLQGGERVLDVGTGLGGTPRALAHLWGCRCHGVELTATRCRDATELTRLVGLEKLVTFTSGDFMSARIEGDRYDLLIGQAAFMHFPDVKSLIRKCVGFLKPGGRLIVEEGYLRRTPSNGNETDQLNALADSWNGRFYILTEWMGWLGDVGFVQERFDDLSELALYDFREQSQFAEQRPVPRVTKSELRGLHLGAELLASGLIGMMRMQLRKGRSAG